jgi:hypothetical protein
MNNHLHPLFAAILAPIAPPARPAPQRKPLLELEYPHEGDYLSVLVYDYSPGTPARISGPPELCDPGDAPEIDWCFLNEDGEELSPDTLPAPVASDIEDRICERFERGV